MAAFVNFDVHSDYSLHDSILTVPALVKAAVDAQMPALAVADTGNLYAAPAHHRLAAAHGIKAISGVAMQLVDDDCGGGLLRLFAVGDGGYRRLCELISRASAASRKDDDTLAPLPLAELLHDPGGLAVLTGGRHGFVHGALRAGDVDQARNALARLREGLSGFCFAEVQRSGFPGETEANRLCVGLADELDVPLLATHPARFLVADDVVTHRIREASAAKGLVQNFDGLRSPTTAASWWRTPAEMAELFADLPDAVANAGALAEAADCKPDFEQRMLPRFPDAPGAKADAALRDAALAGLRRMGCEDAEHRQRLEYELSVIADKGFSDYFMIVADYVGEARRRGIEVGPGRGSGAGSLVACAIGITEVDPLPHGLLFERFLNPERPSLPDFDVDFPPHRRDEVIAYIRSRYGAERVAQIGAVSKIGLRAAVHDTVRTMDLPRSLGQRVAELMPVNTGDVDGALAANPVLQTVYDNDAAARDVIDRARGLVGLARHTTIHPGGVVISPEPLTERAPLSRTRPNEPLHMQMSGEDAEACGFVKFDVLGLATLSILEDAHRRAGTTGPVGGVDDDRPDPKVVELLATGNTGGIFQLESAGMQRVLRDFRPQALGELATVIALYRPGPLQTGMVDDAVKRKHGHAAIRYPHPALEPILKETFGVFVYQEQVMLAARRMAGYSLGQSDTLRKAMGKKKAEEMASQLERFVHGCADQGIPSEESLPVFRMMEKFAGYGFGKAHATAYAILAWRGAWLKAHHPEHYLSAVLTGNAQMPEKLLEALYEAKRCGVPVHPPHINKAQADFTGDGAGGIRYGLAAVKQLGAKGIQRLLDERSRNGPFTGLVDLCERGGLGRAAVENLIDAGALDDWGHRGQLRGALAELQRGRGARNALEDGGQSSMFGSFEDELLDRHADSRDSARDILAAERRALDTWLSGHPIDDYGDLYGDHQATRLVDLLRRMPDESATEEELAEARRGSDAVIAGIVVSCRNGTVRGNVRSTLLVEDATSRVSVDVSPTVRNGCEDTLFEGAALRIGGTLLPKGRDGKPYIRADRIETLDDLRQRSVRRLVLDTSRCQPGGRQRLLAVLRKAPPGQTVVEGLDAADGSYTVGLTPELWDGIGRLLPPGAYRGEYGDAEPDDAGQSPTVTRLPTDGQRALRRNRAQWRASVDDLKQAMNL